LLLTAGEVSNKTGPVNIIAAGLFCACLGVLIHNLIDFAVFEPGVFTTFWAILACLIALDFGHKSRRQFVGKPALFTRILVTAGGLVIVWAYLNYAFVPVAKGGANIKLAMQGVGYDSELLNEAAKDDALDPLALNLNGRLYLQRYNEVREKRPVLKKAAKCFLAAIERNEANFKNYDKLSTVYNLLGEPQEAYEWGLKAAKRYPGSARLQFKLAEIAEGLGKTTLAIGHYNEAIDIEDKYRDQFQRMYPEREEIVSRLGEEKYKKAKQRIEFLSQQSAL